MGELLDELNLEKQNKTSLSRLRRTMTDEEFLDLMKAMSDLSISSRAIHSALARRGCNAVGLSTLTHLRKKFNEVK